MIYKNFLHYINSNQRWIWIFSPFVAIILIQAIFFSGWRNIIGGTPTEGKLIEISKSQEEGIIEFMCNDKTFSVSEQFGERKTSYTTGKIWKVYCNGENYYITKDFEFNIIGIIVISMFLFVGISFLRRTRQEYLTYKRLLQYGTRINLPIIRVDEVDAQAGKTIGKVIVVLYKGEEFKSEIIFNTKKITLIKEQGRVDLLVNPINITDYIILRE